MVELRVAPAPPVPVSRGRTNTCRNSILGVVVLVESPTTLANLAKEGFIEVNRDLPDRNQVAVVDSRFKDLSKATWTLAIID
jgi:hypothetical protein